MLCTAGLQKDTFMTKKLLIDAHQPEETRVVLLNGNKIEEFDYENTSFKQLKGNVYLARVTRVEPSLQAAFVEYGGNRQGFLAFSEIHPDYYRIPIEDREALVAETKQEVDANNSDEPMKMVPWKAATLPPRRWAVMMKIMKAANRLRRSCNAIKFRKSSRASRYCWYRW